MSVCFQPFDSWPPSHFLPQEKPPMDKECLLPQNGLTTEFKPLFSFPTEFPYEFHSFAAPSTLGSPVQSSAETESASDEDDFLTGLTRRLTQKLAVNAPDKPVMAGSPESTLSGIGSLSVSSNGSPNGVLSPPTTPFGATNDTWDLIYAAAGQVAKLKMGSNSGGKTDKFSNFQRKESSGPVRTQIPVTTAVKTQNFSGFCSSHSSFGHNRSHMSQCQNLSRQESMVAEPQCGTSVWERQHMKALWQAQQQHQLQLQMQSRARNMGYENGRSMHPLGMSQSGWTPLQVQQNRQHQHRHHQRQAQHFFHGGYGVKRESAGTGVFLPRRYGGPPDSKSKSSLPSACSTIPLPAKVAHALNLERDDMNRNAHPQQGFCGTGVSEYDALMAGRDAVYAQQKRSLRQEGVVNHEMRLPQEWTY